MQSPTATPYTRQGHNNLGKVHIPNMQNTTERLTEAKEKTCGWTDGRTAKYTNIYHYIDSCY